jgi:hypothetical protein
MLTTTRHALKVKTMSIPLNWILKTHIITLKILETINIKTNISMYYYFFFLFLSCFSPSQIRKFLYILIDKEEFKSRSSHEKKKQHGLTKNKYDKI